MQESVTELGIQKLAYDILPLNPNFLFKERGETSVQNTSPVVAFFAPATVPTQSR